MSDNLPVRLDTELAEDFGKLIGNLKEWYSNDRGQETLRLGIEMLMEVFAFISSKYDGPEIIFLTKIAEDLNNIRDGHEGVIIRSERRGGRPNSSSRDGFEGALIGAVHFLRTRQPDTTLEHSIEFVIDCAANKISFDFLKNKFHDLDLRHGRRPSEVKGKAALELLLTDLSADRSLSPTKIVESFVAKLCARYLPPQAKSQKERGLRGNS